MSKPETYKLAREVAEEWLGPKEKPMVYVKLARLITAKLTPLVEALRHEIQRNHEHSPDSCSGCDGARRELERCK